MSLFGLPPSCVYLFGGSCEIIYVDEIREYPDCKLPWKNWCHMATNGDLEGLHMFAEKLGLQRRWFQGLNHHPHYDLVPSKRALALRLGAVAVTTSELIQRCYTSERGEGKVAAGTYAEKGVKGEADIMSKLKTWKGHRGWRVRPSSHNSALWLAETYTYIGRGNKKGWRVLWDDQGRYRTFATPELAYAALLVMQKELDDLRGLPEGS